MQGRSDPVAAQVNKKAKGTAGRPTLLDEGHAGVVQQWSGAKMGEAPMVKTLNRILWLVQVVGLSLPPMDIPGFRKEPRRG